MEVFLLKSNKKYKYLSIVKLSGNRSAPYLVRLLIGYKSDGNPYYYPLKSFEDELDAMIFRREYSNHPYSPTLNQQQFSSIVRFTDIPEKIVVSEKKVERKDYTYYSFKQVYEDYKEMYFPTKEQVIREKEYHIKAKGKLSKDTMYVRMSSFKSCSSLWETPYKDLRTVDFQNIVNQLDSSKKIQRLKYFLLELDSLAEQKDIISKGYAKYITTSNIEDTQSSVRITFTNKEIQILWDDKPEDMHVIIRDILLILLYSGMRIEELLFMYTKNIYLDEKYMIGGLKTNNGKNRIIPIHHKILPIINKYYNKNNEFLFIVKGKKFPYQKYRKIFIEYMEKLNFNHTTHETRHTAESELSRHKADEISRNLIMGHKTKDTGNDVYGHRFIQELISTIELIKYDNSDSKLVYLRPAN